MKPLRRRTRKLWHPYDGWRWPPPRLVQLLRILVCVVRRHDFGKGWRMETEDWFVQPVAPQPGAWRCCARCGLVEQMPVSAHFNVRGAGRFGWAWRLWLRGWAKNVPYPYEGRDSDG